MILITGSGGLIGSQASNFFINEGHEVIGIDNNLRSYFFGKDGDVKSSINFLSSKKKYKHYDIDIRDYDSLKRIFETYGKEISAVIHCAAQPSHDWAAKEPLTDFSVNATGTMNMLELFRKYSSSGCFIFTSTNKVYGDKPNFLPLVEKDKRWEIDENHKFSGFGIDENLGIDGCLHSIFGASKISADILVQEYGKYFGLNTVSFRGGCLTGPNHQGAELHGFLSYLVKSCVQNRKYSIFGYKGKQVRDNIHSNDLVLAFNEFIKKPKCGEVYNIGGGIYANVSMIEAIEKIQELCGKNLEYTILDKPRIGDHIWYISDLRKFMNDYPNWKITRGIDSILEEMVNFECEKL
jgi:CDP-paratose 2-epimerase